MLEGLKKIEDGRTIYRPVGIIEFCLEEDKPTDVYIPLLKSVRRGEYELPGGEGLGLQLTDDLIREIYEETGLRIDALSFHELPLTIDNRQISGRHYVKGRKGKLEIVSKPFNVCLEPVKSLPHLTLDEEHDNYVYILFHLGDTEEEIRKNAQIRNDQIGGIAIMEGRSDKELYVLPRGNNTYENVSKEMSGAEKIQISDVSSSALSRYFKYKFDNE